MIVREKAPKYLAYTWPEFIAAINALNGQFPKEATCMGHKCQLNTTGTGYFIYDEGDKTETIMTTDTILLFYGEHYEYTQVYSESNFWDQYERVIWR